METNLGLILSLRAAEMPEETAILRPRWFGRMEGISFASLEQEAQHFVELFARAALTPGDPVLVLVPVSATLYAVLAALFRCGLTAVFVDPSAGRDHVARCCSLLPPRAVVRTAKAALLDFLYPAVRRISIKLSASGTRFFKRKGAPAAGVLTPVSPDTPALITFTSGSTGLPKAAVRTHGFLWQQYLALQQTMSYVAGEREITTLPIFVLANLAAGVGTVIPPGDFRRPGSIPAPPVLRAIAAHGVQRITASPAFLERLVAELEASGETCGTVRRIFTGGAPVFLPLVRRTQAVFPKAHVVAVYGSTEAEPIAEIGAESICAEDERRMAAGEGLLTGKPVEAIRAVVLNASWGVPLGPLSAEEFAARLLQTGEAGEIVVAGGHVLSGYLGGRGDDETKIHVDGQVWHRTGDLGRFDTRGRLWLLGRASAKIEDSRGCLFPFSLEVRLSFLPSLRRSAVLGHEDARVLFVDWHRSASAEEQARLREIAASAGIGRIVEGPIPVDARHNAKVNYPELAKRIGKPRSR